MKGARQGKRRAEMRGGEDVGVGGSLNSRPGRQGDRSGGGREEEEKL